jgi:hypothetical protein
MAGLLTPISSTPGSNDVLLRRCPAEHVPSPTSVVEELLTRCGGGESLLGGGY